MQRLPKPTHSTALATRLGGVHHGPGQTLHSVAALSDSAPGCLSFAARAQSAAGCVLVRSPVPGTCIVVADPKAAFIQVLQGFERAAESHHAEGHRAEIHRADLHPTALVPEGLPEGVAVGAYAVVHASVTLRQGVVIHPGVVVGAGCHLGPRTVLHPRVVLYPGVHIGQDCVIHAGAVLGGPGFGLHPGAQGLERIPHVGNLVLQDRVHVGANCTIDRAFIATTLVESGVQIDSQVHIGHNAVIGHDSVIAAQAGLSGSVTLEPGVVLGGQVGVVDHVRIGRGAQVGAGSGVLRDVPAGQAVLGSPADKRIRTLRRWAAQLRAR